MHSPSAPRRSPRHLPTLTPFFQPPKVWPQPPGRPASRHLRRCRPEVRPARAAGSGGGRRRTGVKRGARGRVRGELRVAGSEGETHDAARAAARKIATLRGRAVGHRAEGAASLPAAARAPTLVPRVPRLTARKAGHWGQRRGCGGTAQVPCLATRQADSPLQVRGLVRLGARAGAEGWRGVGRRRGVEEQRQGSLTAPSHRPSLSCAPPSTGVGARIPPTAQACRRPAGGRRGAVPGNVAGAVAAKANDWCRGWVGWASRSRAPATQPRPASTPPRRNSPSRPTVGALSPGVPQAAAQEAGAHARVGCVALSREMSHAAAPEAAHARLLKVVVIISATPQQAAGLSLSGPGVVGGGSVADDDDAGGRGQGWRGGGWGRGPG